MNIDAFFIKNFLVLLQALGDQKLKRHGLQKNIEVSSLVFLGGLIDDN